MELEELTKLMDRSTSTARRSYTIRDALELKPAEAAKNCIVEGLIYRHGYTIISAAPKAGKTFAALDLAFAIASGQPFLGQETHRGPVLIIDLENNWDDVLAPRIAAICKGRELTPDVDLYVEQPDDLLLDTEDGLDSLDYLLSEYKPVLVIIDPLVAALAEDENDNSHVRRTLSDVKSLLRKHDCGLLLLHHTRKPQPGQSRRTSVDSRGAGDITGGSDVSIILSGNNSQDINTLTVDLCRRRRTVETLRYRLLDQDDGSIKLVTETEHQETTHSRACAAIVDLLSSSETLTTGEINEKLSLSEGAWARAKAQLLAAKRIEQAGRGTWRLT